MKKKKTNQEQLKVLLPETFSADQILKPIGMRKDLQTNIKAGMYFILDTLIVMSQSRRWRDYYDEHGGYPLHSCIMNNIIGKKYTTVIDLLVKNCIINQTKGYQTGRRTKLFTLTKKYISTGHKIRPIPKDANLYKRLLEYRLEQKVLNEAALSKIKYITKWFDPKRLTLDHRRSHALIEFYMAEMNALVPDPVPKGRSMEEIDARIALRVNSMLDTFNAVSDGYMGLKKTGQDNRLHSVVSSTKKELRGLYLYDGEPMVSIDIMASQPYLLSQLLNPKSWEKKGLVAKVYPELYSRITPKYKRQLDAILMFGAFSKTPTGKGFQKTSFFKLKWDTDFYQHLVDMAKFHGKGKVFPDRSAVKKKMMIILFDDGAYMDQDKGFILFEKWFPIEASMIMLLKNLSRETKVSDQNDSGTNFLPILLQRIESFLILEKVSKKISVELPDAPIIPVHDCIMTTREYSDQVANITLMVLKKITGLTPGIKIEAGVNNLERQYINELAAQDLSKILDKKPKGRHFKTGLKPPLLTESPGIGNEWLIYSRYTEEGVFEQDDTIFCLIDDTIDK